MIAMSTPSTRSRTSSLDRRRATRTPISGPVEISFATPGDPPVQAEMVESSATGFRIAHHARGLVPGAEVSFHHAAASGRARVVWTQVLQDRCLSGLHLL